MRHAFIAFGIGALLGACAATLGWSQAIETTQTRVEVYRARLDACHRRSITERCEARVRIGEASKGESITIDSCGTLTYSVDGQPRIRTQ